MYAVGLAATVLVSIEPEKVPSLGDARLTVVQVGAEMLGERAHLLVASDDGFRRPAMTSTSG